MKNLVATKNLKTLKRKAGRLASAFFSLALLGLNSCALFGVRNDRYEAIPIENPFGDFYTAEKQKSSPLVLRTKKGDRSIEVELPEGTDKEMGSFIMPVSPEFKDSLARNGGLSGNSGGAGDDYREKKTTFTDRDILSRLPKGSADENWKRQEIEQGLGLMESGDGTPERDQSYLGSLDYTKQLFKTGRLEAALLELDQMIKLYPTDPKLFEMRGTILEKLGYKDLALKSWAQALDFDPTNEPLRKYVDRKSQIQSRRPASP